MLNGENRNGGILPVPPGGHPAWNLYFATADTDATVQTAQELGGELVNEVGALTWNDLMSPDIPAAAEFYRALFGWGISEIEGAEGRYWSITNDGRINGGIMPTPEGGHPVWNLYFAVEDADAAVAKAGELGASTIMGATDVPNGTRFAILSDPTGAVFSIAAGEMDD